MKFSTRARYGLRMMVELARELKKENIVHLKRISEITGVSDNYLAQLAIPLRSAGLVVGVSGKKGGYLLGRPPEEIKVSDIIDALIGPMGATECVNSPEICMNSSFCEARMIWVILSGRLREILDEFTLAEMIDKKRLSNIRQKYARMPLLNPDRVLARGNVRSGGCCSASDNEFQSDGNEN